LGELVPLLHNQNLREEDCLEQLQLVQQTQNQLEACSLAAVLNHKLSLQEECLVMLLVQLIQSQPVEDYLEVVVLHHLKRNLLDYSDLAVPLINQNLQPEVCSELAQHHKMKLNLLKQVLGDYLEEHLKHHQLLLH